MSFWKPRNKKVVTRFAPSPTGFMHIGGVRTAIYAWAFARQNKGSFILRIEDTDKEREIEGSTEHIKNTFKWLGISWNEGPDIEGPHAPYIQSKRLDLYKLYAQKLIDKGLAYADPYTKEEVEVFRNESQRNKKPFLFREYRPKNPPRWNSNMPLRFKIPEIKTYNWHDEVRGNLSAGPEALDDFIIIKSDGYPTYNFAHIVDDFEMGVTHIMRGDEFLSSVPKFLALYEALDIKPPKFVTLPPIMAPDGKKKLGKRDGAKDILLYKEEGYLPEAIINFLVLIGWNPGTNQEIIRRDEFIKIFDIKKIQKSGGNFDEKKLAWINKEYLKLLNKDEQINYVSKFVPDFVKNNDILKKITPIILERVSNGNEIREMFEHGELDFFFQKPKYDKEKLLWKPQGKNKEELYKVTKKYLKEAISIIDKIPEIDFTEITVKNILWPYAEKVGKGDLLWPIRYALSGKDRSPDPFVLSGLLGKVETINRLNYAVSLL